METDYENPLYSIIIHGIALRVLKKSKFAWRKKNTQSTIIPSLSSKVGKTAVAKPTLVGVTYTPKLILCGQAPDAITTVDLPLHLRKTQNIFAVKIL